MAITRGGLEQLALAERLRYEHDNALWQYRFHNGRDHCNRASFNHWTRVADECNRKSGQFDNVMGCPVSLRDLSQPTGVAETVDINTRTNVRHLLQTNTCAFHVILLSYGFQYTPVFFVVRSTYV